jgi:hypothetical protein
MVERAGRRMRAATLALGACWWLVTALGAWLLLFVIDNLLGLPAGLRLPLAIGSLLVSGLGFFRKVWRPATRRLRPEGVAVALEARYQVPDNLLINAYQFQNQPLRDEEKVFVRKMFASCDAAVGRVQLRELWDARRLAWWTLGAVAVITAWLAYIAFFPAFARNAGLRFVQPLADVPPASAAVLQLVPATDVTIGEGENLDVSITVEFNGEPRQAASAKPQIVWQENVGEIPASRTIGEPVPMHLIPEKPWTYGYTFTDVRRPFAFRVFGFATYTRSIRVTVRPLPRLMSAEFRLTPPAYTGQKPVALAGPPAPVTALPGSQLDVTLDVQPLVNDTLWVDSVSTTAFKAEISQWMARTIIRAAGPYAVLATDVQTRRQVTLARGAIRLETDNPPEVDFVTDDRNRFTALGATVKLEVLAKDDFGVRAIQITARPVEQERAPVILKTWSYIGPPGNPGPFKEVFNLVVDPQRFEAGTAYLLEAVAGDFCPGRQLGKSRPLVLRIRSAAELTLASTDPLNEGFENLKRAAALQESANSLTANLTANLDEAIGKRDLARHQAGIADRQTQAYRQGQAALTAFRQVPAGKPYAAALAPVVNGEMPWVLGDITKLAPAKREAVPALLAGIQKREEYILNTLLSLLGQIADARKEKPPAEKALKTEQNPPLATADNLLHEMKNDLQQFVREQEKILERSQTLLDKRPEDLTKEEEKILGDLAREEADWSKFFEEKLTDFAKLPQQDFADGSLAKELNAVFQEIDKAAKELYAKKVELAVPQEQAGWENAKELVQNLERWLTNKPDYQKWLMEESPLPADIALAELPAELEDITGELLDKEEEMKDDVEDVTSSWLDSLDKGIGWDAMDGPISDMSAKGITGNLLPNQMEIGGRSGEGRTGRSSGQMVQDSAVGKGGRETPTRLTPTPFEAGSVKDADKRSHGGATGGGKLSGFDGEGLRGPASPASNQNAPRLAEQQAKIRQQAEALAWKLRHYKLPTGDLEASVQAMKRVETSLQQRDGLGVRRAFSRAVDALQEARQTVKTESRLTRERTKLPAWLRAEIMTSWHDGAPRGYEEMVSEYFRALAEGAQK